MIELRVGLSDRFPTGLASPKPARRDGPASRKLRERFFDYVAKLSANGTVIPADRVELLAARTPSLGRRHVAGLLVACGLSGNTNGAFYRYLHPIRGSVVSKITIPTEEAIRLVRKSGGKSGVFEAGTER